MGGLNLELFKVCASSQTSRALYPIRSDGLSPKFGLYVGFPVGIMWYFGTNLDNRFSVPGFWPTREQSHKIPTVRDEIRAERERLRAKRLYLREKRLEEEARRAQTQQGEPQS